MVKKFFKKVMPLVMAVTMTLSMSIAFAANGNYTEDIDTTKATITIPKYVVLNEFATAPVGEFEFTLAAATSDDLSTNVKVGINPELVSITKATFNGQEISSTDTTDKGALSTKVIDSKKFVVENFTLDFSNVPFTEPGAYRYVLSETQGNIAGMTYDNSTRYIDVYVFNNEQGNGLVIKNVVMFTEKADFEYSPEVNDERIGKDEGFINELETYDLSVTKTLSGNQANMNAKFDFSIEIDTSEITSAYQSATYIIQTIGDATLKNPTTNSITVSDGKTTIEVSLGHNGNIVIKDLPKGTKIKVTDDKGLYTATYTVNSGESKDGNIYTLDSLENNTNVVFDNELEGTIPTGVFLAVGPMLVVVVIGIMGMILVKRNHKEEEED